MSFGNLLVMVSGFGLASTRCHAPVITVETRDVTWPTRLKAYQKKNNKPRRKVVSGVIGAILPLHTHVAFSAAMIYPSLHSFSSCSLSYLAHQWKLAH
jgi:hypothetical protein